MLILHANLNHSITIITSLFVNFIFLCHFPREHFACLLSSHKQPFRVYFYSLRCNLVLCQFSSDVHFPYFLCLNWIIKGLWTMLNFFYLISLKMLFFPLWSHNNCRNANSFDVYLTQVRNSAMTELSYVIKSISLMLNWTYRDLCVHCAHMKLYHNRESRFVTQVKWICNHLRESRWFAIVNLISTDSAFVLPRNRSIWFEISANIAMFNLISNIDRCPFSSRYDGQNSSLDSAYK